MGMVFFDAGQVYGSHADMFTSFRTSVGTGLRWFSPMGPLVVEWGFNLKKHHCEKSSVPEFTMGGSF